MIRLTKQQAKKIGYMKITDWFAIQPVELKDGTFILPEDVLPHIEKFVKQDRAKRKVSSTLADLKKRPIKKLNKKELKVSEEFEMKKK